MINEVIRGISQGKVKPNKKNAIAFGLYEYPKSIRQAWKQFKMELWLKK
jgi:hypothetical protein